MSKPSHLEIGLAAAMLASGQHTITVDAALEAELTKYRLVKETHADGSVTLSLEEEV